MPKTELSKVRVYGSVEELQEMGLDPAVIGSCAPEDRVRGIAGCQLYSVCKESKYKGLTGRPRWMKDGEEVDAKTEGAVREGPGPLNVAVRETTIFSELKVKVINSMCPCWYIPHRRRNHEAGNAVRPGTRLFQVIGVEGQHAYLPGSKVEMEDGKPIHKPVHEGIRTWIKPMARPNENPDLRNSAFAIAELRRDSDRLQEAPLGEFLKLKQGEKAADAGGTKRGPASRG